MKKKQIYYATLMIIITILSLFLINNKNEESETLRIYDAFDTYSEITIPAGKKSKEILSECAARLYELDEKFSAYKEESEISMLNSAAGITPVKLSEDTFEILDIAKKYSMETNGYFDVTIGALYDLWGFNDEPHRPTPEEISKAIHKTGFDFLKLDKDAGTAELVKSEMKVDLGAIAKGYAADEIVKILKKHKINSALVNLGGNIYSLGTLADGTIRSIGIQDPGDSSKLVGSIKIGNSAVVTSGDYIRFFEQDGEKYHHILNPYTGMPSNSGLKSVTIVGKNATIADILSTACFVIGYENSLPLLKECDAEAVFVTDKMVYYTSGLADKFEYDNASYEYVQI